MLYHELRYKVQLESQNDGGVSIFIDPIEVSESDNNGFTVAYRYFVCFLFFMVCSTIYPHEEFRLCYPLFIIFRSLMLLTPRRPNMSQTI